MIGSKNSIAVGNPDAVKSSNNRRAVFKPVSMSWELSRCGSLINPFQLMAARFPEINPHHDLHLIRQFLAQTFNLAAYSCAPATSWIEHGPTTTSNRESRCPRIALIRSRLCTTVAFEARSSAVRPSTRGESTAAPFPLPVNPESKHSPECNKLAASMKVLIKFLTQRKLIRMRQPAHPAPLNGNPLPQFSRKWL